MSSHAPFRGRATAVSRLALSFILAAPGSALAFHPLATDDAGTQGGGAVELELSTLAAQAATEDDAHHLDVALAAHAGLAGGLDIGLTLTLSALLDDGSVEKGIADPVLDLKWRVVEAAGPRPAIALRLDYKPPHHGALSTRSHDGGALVIGSWGGERLAVHLNGGVIARGMGRRSSELAGLGAVTVTALVLPRLTGAVEVVSETRGLTATTVTTLAGLVWRASGVAAVSLGLSRSFVGDGHRAWSALAGVTAALGG